MPALASTRARLLGAVIAVLAVLLSLAVVPTAQAAVATGTLTGEVRDPAGNGRPALVSFYQYDGSAAYTGTRQVSVSGGSFRVVLPIGRYKVLVNDHEWDRAAWVGGGTSLADAHEFELGAAETVDLVRTVFVPRAQVKGVVHLDPRGPGADDRSIVVYLQGTQISRSGWANAAGDFVIAHVPAGQYTLRAETIEQTHGAVEVSVMVPETGEVVVPPISLQQQASISGRATAPGGEPLGDLKITAKSVGGPFQKVVHTDAQGRYLVAGMDAGDYQVSVSDPAGEYETAMKTITALATREQRGGIDFGMTPLAVSTEADLTGKVTVSDGAPLQHVSVRAYGDNGHYADTTTARNGRYRLTGLMLGESYKLKFVPPQGEIGYFEKRWYDAPTEEAATPLTVTATSGDIDRNVVLPRWGALSGTVTGTGPGWLNGTVVFHDVKGERRFSADIFDGAWSRPVPAGTYYLQFSGKSYVDHGPTTVYLDEWHENAAWLGRAKPVVVGVGEGVTVNTSLSHHLEANTAPSIAGAPVVGGTLTASPGEFTRVLGVTYAYTWLRGATVVGTGQTYRPTAGDVGAALTVRVDATLEDLAGSAVSAATTPVVSDKRASSTLLKASKPKKGKVTLTATVKVPGVAKPTGTVTITRGGAVVGRGTVKNGKAVVRLAKQPKGPQTYQATYGGTGAIAPSSSAPRAVKIK